MKRKRITEGGRRRKTELNKELKNIDSLLGNVDDKFYSGITKPDEYKKAKERYNAKYADIQSQIASLDQRDKDMMKYVDFGLNLLRNIDEYYVRASVEIKQKMISSMFPSKLIFDGEKYRTTKSNEFLDLLSRINGSSELGVKEKVPNNRDQSNQAPQVGLEPTTL